MLTLLTRWGALAALLAATLLLPACMSPDPEPYRGHGDHHRPQTRPAKPGVKVSVIEVIGSDDDFGDTVVMDCLKRTQGVLGARYDPGRDVFVIEHRPSQVGSARLLTRIKQAGADAGYRFDPKTVQ